MSTRYVDAAVENVSDFVEKHPYISLCASIYIAASTISFLKRLRQPKPTKLNGPPSPSVVFGQSVEVLKSPDSAAMYEGWVEKYGPVFRLPLGMGRHSVVLCDPAAVASMLSKDTTVYHQPKNLAIFFGTNFGKNLLVVDGEDHKRHVLCAQQRRALSSGFSLAAIRNLLPVFYHSVRGVKENWDSAIEANQGAGAIVDVQSWMNNITLDSICIGGFSHDPGATRGSPSAIATHFESFTSLRPSLVQAASFLLCPFFPPLAKLPTARRKLTQLLAGSFEEIGVEVLDKAKREKETGVNEGIDKSILGALVRSENASDKIRMNLEEIKAQINLFMIAGYETTATTLTWALIELARNPAIQQQLREELTQFSHHGEEPTYEQLGSDLPYLDAIVCEVLRLHPSLPERARVANEDDILPLSSPLTDAFGNLITEIIIPRGTPITIPINAINRLPSLWGSDSHTFNPSRWTTGQAEKGKSSQIQGYRHLLTFADGPRTCMGKVFAVMEVKAVLAVLVREYVFEFPEGSGGKETKLGVARGLLLRPKVEGEERARVPMVIRKAG